MAGTHVKNVVTREVIHVLHGWVVINTYAYAYVRVYWAYFTSVYKTFKTVQKLPVFGHKYYESRHDRTGNEASVVEKRQNSRRSYVLQNA